MDFYFNGTYLGWVKRVAHFGDRVAHRQGSSLHGGSSPLCQTDADGRGG